MACAPTMPRNTLWPPQGLGEIERLGIGHAELSCEFVDADVVGTEAIALLTRCSLSNPPDRSLFDDTICVVSGHSCWRARARLQWPRGLKPSEIIRICRGSQGPTDGLSSDCCVEAC